VDYRKRVNKKSPARNYQDRHPAELLSSARINCFQFKIGVQIATGTGIIRPSVWWPDYSPQWHAVAKQIIANRML